MAVQGTDRWADIVSENSSTVSTSDEELQSDLELEDTSSDVNDINAVAVQSEILAPQGLLKDTPHWEHEVFCFTKQYKAFAEGTLLQSYVIVEARLWIIDTCIVRRVRHVPLGLHCCGTLDPISRSFCLCIEDITGIFFLIIGTKTLQIFSRQVLTLSK